MIPLVRLFIISLAFSNPAIALWPRPKSLTNGTTILTLASSDAFTILADGLPDDLQQAAGRTKDRLFQDNLQELVPAHVISNFDGAPALSQLTLTLTGSGNTSITEETTQLTVENRTESYKLTVPDDGSAATLTSDSALGLFRGLTTFEQLWFTSGDASTVYTAIAPIEIDDSPAYVGSVMCLSSKPI